MDQEQEFPAVVDLNVGGRHFTTHLSTLTKEPESMLAAMFSGRHPCSKDKDGRFFIDADGDIFCHILNYLRFDRLPSADLALLVYEQARYFGLQSLISRLESYSSVRHEKYLEKIRSVYPWYRDFVDKCFEQVNNRQLIQIGASVNFQFPTGTRVPEDRMCENCRNTVWKAVVDDPRGEALDYLIRHELEKRNFDVSKFIASNSWCGNNVQHQPMNTTCGTEIRYIEVRV